MAGRIPIEIALNFAVRETFPFLGLPRQLRDMVYGFYLYNSDIVLGCELEDIPLLDAAQQSERRAIGRRSTQMTPLHKTSVQIYHELMIISDKRLSTRKLLPMLNLSLLSPRSLNHQTLVFAKQDDMARINTCSIPVHCSTLPLTKDPALMESFVDISIILALLKRMPKLRYLSVNLIDCWNSRPGLPTARKLMELTVASANTQNMARLYALSMGMGHLDDFVELEEVRVLLSGRLVANHRRLLHECVTLGEWESWKGTASFDWAALGAQI